MFGEMQVIFK